MLNWDGYLSYQMSPAFQKIKLPGAFIFPRSIFQEVNCIPGVSWSSGHPLYTVKCLPYVNLCHFAREKTRASIPFYIGAYHVSASVTVRLMYAGGWPFYRRAAPKSLWMASHSIDNSAFGS